MNEKETKIADALLDDIQKATASKDRFAAIERYDLFCRAVCARVQAERK